MQKIYASMMAGEAKGGQATTEYIVVIALLILAAAAALYAYRDQLINIWDSATANLYQLATEGSNVAVVQDMQREGTTAVIAS